ncbi:MAG: hypothetical protein LBK25_05860 [Treponema sp.]|nr:hypothetical protein [Treponema sp.]
MPILEAMVMYHCSIIVTSQALILHRLSVNSSEKAVLLIHDSSANAEAGSRETVDAIFRGGLDLPSIRESGVFEKVIVCDSFSGLNLKAKDIGSYEKRIRESFDGTFAENNITLDDFTAFYTANDWWEGEFKVYLSLNNRKCHIIESIKDAFYSAYFINDSVYKSVLLKHNAAYPDGISDVAVIRNTSIKSIEKYKNKNVEIWDVEKALNSSSNESINKILIFYKHYNISPKSNSVLMLLNNPRFFHYDGAVKNSDTRVLRYYTKFGFTFDYKKAVNAAKYSEQIALSFYVDESSYIYLKHHPRSWFSTEEMQDYFGEKTYSLSPLPIDFYNILREAQSMKFDKAICFSSSSNQFVETVASKYVLLGTDFYKSYFYYLKLYSALAFILSHLDSGPPPHRQFIQPRRLFRKLTCC